MAQRARLAGLCLAFASAASAMQAHAQDAPPELDTSSRNLFVVLRESMGENKQDEELTPYGRIVAQLPDGQRVELAASWYQYLGDMHIRLVFEDGPNLQSAEPNDLERLRLTPEEALDVALANMRRVYGKPTVAPWMGGLMQVQSSASDFASSWFLDHGFWADVLKSHPEGVVAGVPQRGGLVFASATDAEALDELRFSTAALYAGDDGRRLSSALYLFRGGHWSVFQAPQRTVSQ